MSSPIMPGAEIFVIIVCILAGVLAGIVNIDVMKTLFKSEKKSEQE
jgi:hypothetical protein